VVDQDQSDSAPSYSGRIESDDLSDCGSEDVDVVPHRYDPPTRAEDPEAEPEVVSYSLADEIRMSLANKKVKN
jgi:hypothetical protein